MRLTPLLFAFLAQGAFTIAAPVTNWVTTNGNAGFSAGSAATNSPVTTDADGDTIIGAFPEITLAAGWTITLSGQFNVGGSGTLAGGNFRIGIYDSTLGLPTANSGSGYVGALTNDPSGATFYTTNGSATNPFAGANSVNSVPLAAGSALQAGTTYDFSLALTREANGDLTFETSISDGAGTNWNRSAAVSTTGTGTTYTFNCAGFLLGGSLNKTSAAFTNIQATLTAFDSDEDGMEDAWETDHGLIVGINDSAGNPDNDGLTNIEEYLGADAVADTGDETDPQDADTDDDGINDGPERVNGTNPIDPDTDHDGLLDGVETNTGNFVDANNTGTDPLNPDSDDDGARDGDEVTAGYDPTDPQDTPPQAVRLFGIDFNRNDAYGSPGQSLFRSIAGSTAAGGNTASYTKMIGGHTVTIVQPDAQPFEFRGANTDSTRAIPGGESSRSYLVSDFIATRKGRLEIHVSNLAAGTYHFRSFHLEPFTGTGFGYAQGSTTTTPNTIEARVGGALKDSVQATCLGTPGLNTTFINDSQIPTLDFYLTHDGSSELVIELSATESNGVDSFLLLNGFELFSF